MVLASRLLPHMDAKRLNATHVLFFGFKLLQIVSPPKNTQKVTLCKFDAEIGKKKQKFVFGSFFFSKVFGICWENERVV